MLSLTRAGFNLGRGGALFGKHVGALPCLNTVAQLPNYFCTQSCHYRHVSIPVLPQAGEKLIGDQPFCSFLEPWTLEIWQDIGCIDYRARIRDGVNRQRLLGFRLRSEFVS